MKRTVKVMGTIILVFIGLLCVCLLIVWIYSPGKLSPLRDVKGKIIQGSISEKVWIDVNGSKQGMFIRGENPNNPVVLYLHGGPGTPMLQFISYLEKEKDERLEKYFTVCYWDQRGSGMSYKRSTDPLTLTVDQMVEDTREVTEYLKKRFGQEKIYLIGHSWGSYLGVKTIEIYPDNYLAYIGIGQTSYQTQSERLAYDYMLNHAKETNDRNVIEKLERYNPYSEDFPSVDYLVKGRTGILNKYKIGHLHQGLVFTDVLNSLFAFKGYTLAEKINWFCGADFSMVYLFPIMLKDDLFISSEKFEIPFYVIHGAYDYQVSQVLAEKYLNVLEAPKKEFFIFENSAHSPNLEEPEKFVKIFRRIASENPLKEQ